MTLSVDQTVVKIKEKKQIIVIVMMWGRHEFINERKLESRFKGLGRTLEVRSLNDFAH